jgi:hypothetical protein
MYRIKIEVYLTLQIDFSEEIIVAASTLLVWSQSKYLPFSSAIITQKPSNASAPVAVEFPEQLRQTARILPPLFSFSIASSIQVFTGLTWISSDEEDEMPSLEELGVSPADEELGFVSMSDDELTPTEDDDGVSITEELDGSSPPSSPEQERVNAKARAKVVAMIVFIVRSPLLGVK